jgi:anaerobic magnesium-protoporphyrin IX monomethyl ester cyclase
MKVLLINPPSENEIVADNPPVVDAVRGCNPPLGLLYVAGYLQAHAHHDIEILDTQVDGVAYGELRELIARSGADVVGLTAMTMTLIDVMRTVSLVKEIREDTKVVLGGPHVNLFPNETIQLPGVDFLVLGEGEETFSNLLNHIDHPNSLREIRGLVFNTEDGIVHTGERPLFNDLNELPFPARQLTHYQKYGSVLASNDIVTTIFTSRGCPFRCAFCDRPHLGKVFRARSAKNVVDEIESCVKMGIREFLVYDDTFTVVQKRVLDICDLIVERKLDIRFDIRARVDTINDLMIRKLKAAGCVGINYGVEAGSPEVLKTLDKGITLDQVRNAFKITKKHGIDALAYFMIGNPGETEKEIQDTFRLIGELEPDYLHMTVLTPFPATRIYADALNRGIITHDVWREFAANPDKDFVPPHWGEHFTREELNQRLEEAYQRFYLRPGYVLRRLMKVRSAKEFLKKARAGLRILRMKI